ncbi:MAG: radical SAM family heme chaperone HemW [Rhodobacteraceae bacterium]|nr:radical SAM family heme chaperone HemW [Paracoccaceae bacterium]
MPEDPESSFGIYVHWPFCQALCPYCDFNKYLHQNIDHAMWCESYLTALQTYSKNTSLTRCQSVYFGGGTPSLMNPSTCGRILALIDQLWGFNSNPEFTLEANPTSVEANKLAQFKDNGINRISLGIQSLKNTDLQRLGRRHSVAEAIKAYQIARNLFSNVSLDLIFGRQNQTLLAWQRELQEALNLMPEHLSIYQLTIESGTVFGKLKALNKLTGLPCEETLATMYELTMATCQNAGYNHYEVSNFAYPGYEGRHNLMYWQSKPFLGIGPGAHGRIKIDQHYYRTETILAPEAWLTGVKTNGTGESFRHRLEAWEQAEEYLMMGLRLNDGISLARFNTLAPHHLNKSILEMYVGERLLSIDEQRLKATQKGRLVLNRIIADLLP